jgi:2'-5' RNA ligase
MKRIFIGIKIKPDQIFCGLIDSLRDAMKEESIRWTDISNFHITLSFLGNTEEEIIDIIKPVIKESCGNSEIFDIVLKGVGVFKNLHDPRVLWVGIDKSDSLKKIQSKITEGLINAGVKTDDKPFSPHLTIGRIKHINDPDILRSLLMKHHDYEVQRVSVGSVILYESVLSQEGPLYKNLAEYRLN